MRVNKFALATLCISTFLSWSERDCAADFVLINGDEPGTGFNDPTVVSPEGGNPGTTLGEQRLFAAEFVLSILSNVIESPVDVRVRASFDALTCGAGGGVLAQAAPFSWFRDFPNAPLADTWYPVALASAIAGEDQDPSIDMFITFNRRIDENCLGGSFDYAVDGSDGSFSFTKIVAHELVHGLGMSYRMFPSSGNFFLGSPSVYAAFSFDSATGRFMPESTPAQRVASLQNNALVWRGASVTEYAAQRLEEGSVLSVHYPEMAVKLYSPNEIIPGSTWSHFDVSVSPNALMEPILGFIEAPISRSLDLIPPILRDMGWTIRDSDDDLIPQPLDNCQSVANTKQIDADADGVGNRCDPDFNNDCVVNVIDLGQLRSNFFSDVSEFDLNSDGSVNVADLGILRTLFFQEPGPSAFDLECITDFDGDGLTNTQELGLGTDPENPDTDDGGVDDGTEVLIDFTNPLDPNDDLNPTAGLPRFPAPQTRLDIDLDDIEPLGTGTNVYRAIAVISEFNDTLVILESNGAGTYTQRQAFSLPRPMYLEVSDVNNDGNDDILVISQSQSSLTVFLASDTGAYLDGISFNTAASPRRFITGDLNGDEITDVVTLHAVSGAPDQASVLVGDGLGSFSPGFSVDLTGSTRAITIDDINGDGREDILASDASGTIVALLAEGSGFTAPGAVATLSTGPYSVAQGDINGDGLDDLIGHGNRSLSVFIAVSPGVFSGEVSIPISVGTDSSGYQQLLVADTNDDGSDEIIVGGNNDVANATTIELVRWTQENDLDRTTYASGTRSTARIAGSDANNDGRLDILVVSNRTIATVFGVQDGALQALQFFSLSGLNNSFAVADTSTIDRFDLLWTGGNTVLKRRRWFGPGTFQITESFTQFGASDDIDAADFDGDGISDVVTVGSSTRDARLYFGSEVSPFPVRRELALPAPPSFVVAADFDNDDDPDIAIVSEEQGEIILLRNQGDGVFGQPEQIAVPGAKRLSVADANDDGFADLVIAANAPDTILLYEGSMNGTFALAGSIATTAATDHLIATDLNGDSRTDYALLSGPARSLTIHFGDGQFGSTGSSSFIFDSLPIGMIEIPQLDDVSLVVRTTRNSSIFDTFTPSAFALQIDQSNDIQSVGQFGAGATLFTSTFGGPEQAPHSIRRADINLDGFDDLIMLDYGYIMIAYTNPY